jgi:hypothetical protein
VEEKDDMRFGVLSEELLEIHFFLGLYAVYESTGSTSKKI